MLDFIDYSSDKTTIISQNDTITANVYISDALENYGTINGNVSCDNLLSNYGTISGLVSSSNLIVRENGSIYGDCNVLFDVLEKSKSIIRGDIVCTNIEINGKVYGNIVASNKVVIKESGEVIGDITTKDLSVDIGGVIIGKVKYQYDFK